LKTKITIMSVLSGEFHSMNALKILTILNLVIGMIEFLNIDCMEYMKGLEDNAFDLAIVDPPYGDEKQLGGRPSGKLYHGKDKSWNLAPSQEYFDELKRVSVNQIVWGGNYFASKLGNSRCYVIWKKNIPEKASFSSVEYAWASFNSAPSYIEAQVAGRRGFFTVDGERIHPTQKPIKLYVELLKNYAKEGDRILDTHLGSGSSAIAAHYGGFDFVGCELDKHYFEASQERFVRETSQLAFEYGE